MAYVVNRLSRYAVGHPSFAAQCGEQVLGYLFQTSEVRLRYGKCRPSEETFENELPVPRTPELLEVWTDASFAQADSKSQSGIIITVGELPIGWLSLRQPFVALSTCEAELVSCVEGVVLAQSLRPLLEELSGSKLRWILLNDNVAASTVILYPAGSWRTRHLRLRSRAVQELVDSEHLSLHHIPGKVMTADILTKTLPYQKGCELMGYLGYVGFKSFTPKTKVSIRAVPKLLLLCIAAPPPVEASEIVIRIDLDWDWQFWSRILAMCFVAFCLICGFIWGYRRRRTRYRLQLLRELADQVVAETAQHQAAVHPDPAGHGVYAMPGQEPDPELNPREEVVLWEILAEYGVYVARSLGPEGPEILRLRESSPHMRLRMSMLWADLHPRVPPTPRSEADEDTDSGFIPSSVSSPPSLSREWQQTHFRFGNHPLYSSDRVEDTFHTWIMSNRPYGPELEGLPFVTRLTQPEHEAFHMMIDAYYMHPSSPASSHTAEPLHLMDHMVGDEGTLRRDVVYRTLYPLEAEVGQGIRVPVVEESDSESEEGVMTPELSNRPQATAASSAAPAGQASIPRLVLPADSESDGEEESFPMDHQVASAACLLYQYGYRFDWEQLTVPAKHLPWYDW